MSVTTQTLAWPEAPIAAVATAWSWQALSALDWMFVAALATLLLALTLGRWRVFAPLLAAGYGVQFWALSHADVLTGQSLAASFGLRILRQPVLWRYDSLSWYFAMLTIGAAFVCSLFALAPFAPQSGSTADNKRRAGPRGGIFLARLGSGSGSGIWHLFQVALALSVLSALLLFGSGNLLALYVSWEVVVWSFFLLLAVGGGLALGAAVRYAAYSFAGGVALLGAMVLVFGAAGSFDFARAGAALPSLGLGREILLGLLLSVALGLRLGALPLFAWQGGQARPPVPVFWHGIAARVGFFAVLVLLFRVLGPEWLTRVGGLARDAWLNPRLALCWVALILVLFAGWRAWRQRSPGAVLSWLALSQSGFVLLALLLGGASGTGSGLLQLFSLGLAEGVLAGLCLIAAPLVVGAGDPRSLRTPAEPRGLALAAAVLAGASLVGLPPTLGFVSKWLLYDAILSEPLLGLSRWPLFGLALLGSLFSLLALLRLAARACVLGGGQFVGRSQAIMAPVLGLSGLTLLAGVLPGPALGWVAAVQHRLGVPALDWTLGGVTGGIDMPWLTLWQLLLLLPVALVFWWWRRGSSKVGESGAGERLREGAWHALAERMLGAALAYDSAQPVESGQAGADQGAGRRNRLESPLARLLDGLAGMLAALNGPRLAPWTLAVLLVLLLVWSLG